MPIASATGNGSRSSTRVPTTGCELAHLSPFECVEICGGVGHRGSVGRSNPTAVLSAHTKGRMRHTFASMGKRWPRCPATARDRSLLCGERRLSIRRRSGCNDAPRLVLVTHRRWLFSRVSRRHDRRFAVGPVVSTGDGPCDRSTTRVDEMPVTASRVDMRRMIQVAAA